MNQDPNPTDYPELEKFTDWLYTKEPYRNYTFEQLQDAFRIGMECVHSRDGGPGSYIARLEAELKKFKVNTQ